MKFNFKKITPILAGAVLLGSTIGFASAADLGSYPSPFVSGGVADVAVVYGAAANTIDMASATLFTADLSRMVTSTAGGAVISGESVKIETSSEKLNIGENLTGVRTTTITKSDLPTLLQKKTYQSKDGISYDYEQEISLASGLTYTLFADVDSNDRIPTIGISKASNSPIMNYSVKFVKTLESDVASDRLEDIQDTDITILGKSYRILNAWNGTNLKLELMSGAVVDTLLEASNKTYTIGGKDYAVSISNIANDGAALTVNGQTTPKLTTGSTYKLSDGTQVGIRTLWYQSNKVSSVEFSIGAEKLTLEDNQKLKMNDENVNDVVVYLSEGVGSGSKRTISDITLSWITNDKLFMTPAKEALLPGLKSVKISMADLTTPKQEVVTISNSGDNTIQLRAPIKSGTATISLLSANGTKITKLGGESTGTNLVTSGTNLLTFNKTSDQNFVVSWNSSTAAESYLLKVASITKDCPSTGQNCTEIQDAVTSATLCKDKKAGDTCSFGNIILTIGTITDPDGTKVVNMTGGSGVTFNTLYTAEGLKIYLPVVSAVPGKGLINLTNAINYPASWTLVAEEEDKTSNLAAGKNITALIGFASNKLEVNSVDSLGNAFAGGAKFDLGGSTTTSKYVAYIQSDLGTKLTYDTKPDQNTLEIEYHGDAAYGNVFVSSAASTVTGVGGSAVFDVAVPDTEAIPNANLIVIGGSCINKVSAQLLGLTFPACGSAFTDKTTVVQDEAVLKIAANPSYATKVALLVAGWEGKDTKAATKALISKSVALSGKSEAVLKTVTEAQTALK